MGHAAPPGRRTRVLVRPGWGRHCRRIPSASVQTNGRVSWGRQLSVTDGGTAVQDKPGPNITGRWLLAGIGAAGGVVLVGGTADAASPHPSPQAVPDTPPSGLTSIISSAPQPGVRYYFRSWSDFSPEVTVVGDGRRFGGNGVYTDIASDYLAATFD